MNKLIKRLAEEAGFVLWSDEDWNPGDVIDWSSNYDNEIVKYTELVLRESLVEFYRRYLDTNSNDGIAVQVDKFIKEQFGLDND